MAKWWSLLFAVVMLACAASMIAAPFYGMWLPLGVSTHAWDIDFLYYVILAVTGFFFILTEALLIWFMWEYGSRAERGGTASGPTMTEQLVAPLKKFVKNEHQLELAWTIVPAVILLYIAFAQVSAWAEVKYRSRMPKIDAEHMPQLVDVSARQFEWRFRYPSVARYQSWRKNAKLAVDFASTPHIDDVHVVNELHVYTNPNGKKHEEFPAVLAYVHTLDVLHNFNLPQFRVKQDTLPGKTIPVWFRPTRANTRYDEDSKRWLDGWNFAKDREDRSHIWEVACAELCGWGHYRMIARIHVHPDEEDFLKWLKQAEQEQNTRKRETGK